MEQKEAPELARETEFERTAQRILFTHKLFDVPNAIWGFTGGTLHSIKSGR